MNGRTPQRSGSQALGHARHRVRSQVSSPFTITQFVEREEKRETFRQDSLNAWEEYRLTGQHVTAEEADAWLAKLEQGHDVEPPACHV
jgi:predicted transcriptional regulator